MWTLTFCLILILGAVVAAILLSVRLLSSLAEKTMTSTATVLVEALSTLIKPVVNPEPIQQTDIPEQGEMYSDQTPPWATGWDGSPTQD